MMRRIIGIALAALVLLGAALPGSAWAGGPRVRVFVGAGPFWWGPPFFARPFFARPLWYGYPYYSGFYYPPAYGFAPPVYAPPPIVQPSLPGYAQQEMVAGPQQPDYWYYCQDARAYYPYVKQCPRGWMKVLPSPGGAGGRPAEDED